MNLSGKTALVTGGARGIGQAIALALARAGADVAICDVAPELHARATLDGIHAAGRRSLFFQTDVSNRPAVLEMIAQVVASWKYLDILVNNAALNIRKPLLELEVEDVERVWAVSLWGVFHCTQAAARHMVERGSGSIVMISSIHAEQAFPLSTAYNGAKAAVNQMARTWAAELASSNIRVNIVEPGWTDTPGERAFFSEQELASAGARLPLGRLAQPADIANSVVFLASTEASYITGSSIRVDGGISLPRVP